MVYYSIFYEVHNFHTAKLYTLTADTFIFLLSQVLSSPVQNLFYQVRQTDFW